MYKDSFLQEEDDLGYLFSLRKKNFPQSKRETEKVRLEEIYAMMMKQMKFNADRTAEKTFSSGVFTIQDNSMSIRRRK